jgi:putative two-component system response regulator
VGTEAVDRVLFVDDDRSLLDAMARRFHGRYAVHIADSAETGTQRIRQGEPFAIIVSDLCMPGEDGISFLSKASDLSPDSVRIMLTGQAELETSIRAVNEGNIFRLLLKPCPAEILEKALSDGSRQHHLIRTERELYALKKLNESLGGLVQAFIKVMESKDPYTAGHQLRVAEFSVKIAGALGLATDVVEQIRWAAMVHDIGKIYVPVEFLNKAGKLNSCEWNVLKMHPQIGHDILKPVGFPFPIHEIILQHHEKMDGSGYPRGLKRSEIRMEAQIIAVADMVEAMAHHRPYRPAKGLEQAISELRDAQRIQYDDRISDVALSLLTEGRFAWTEDHNPVLIS